MNPVNTNARALAGFLFVATNLVGLGILWAIEPQHLEAGILVLISANMAVLARAARRDRDLLLPLLFAIVFALFHFSLLPIAVFDPHYLIIHPYFSYWYFGPFTKPAYLASLIFFIGTVGGVLAGKRTALPIFSAQPVVEPDGARSDILLLVFAGLILYFFVAVFFVLGIKNYAQYNEVARSENIGLVGQTLIPLYAMIGAMAMLCAARVRSLKLFLTLFAIWGASAFATGLRGAVLFPAALMTPLVLQRLRIRFRVIPVAMVAMALLWLISFGKVFRNSRDWALAASEASPVDALAELGGSLRPVFEIVRWTRSGITDFFWGGTYWAPIERLFMKLMPFTDPIPALLDDRLMNVMIVKVTGGAYGFSIAAEAYANFGYAGAAIIGLLTGYVLARLGRQFTAGHVGILSAALAYALFYHIRQSYVGAWGSFIVVGVFTWAMLRLDSTALRFVALPEKPTTQLGPLSRKRRLPMRWGG